MRQRAGTSATLITWIPDILDTEDTEDPEDREDREDPDDTEDPEELEVTYSSKMNVDAPYIVGIRLILEEPLESELLDEEELKAKLEEEKQETEDSIVEEK